MTDREALRQFEEQLRSAQAVLDSGFGNHSGENNYLYQRRKEMAECAISALRERMEREGGWISVEDRLPEKKGQYIVAFHPCYWDNVQDDICVGMDSFVGKKKWARNKYQRVTHWQPLPKPPKENN